MAVSSSSFFTIVLLYYVINMSLLPFFCVDLYSPPGLCPGSIRLAIYEQ